MAKQAKVWTGSAWADLASATTNLTPYSTTAQMNTSIDNAKGMVLLNKTDFTTQASVAIDNVFTSTYQNYKIILNLTAVSGTDISINWYGRTSASDVTSNYTLQRIYTRSTTLAAVSTSENIIAYTTTGGATSCQFELFMSSPQLAQQTTTFSAPIGEFSAGAPYMNLLWSRNTSTNQFDGIKIYPSTGTFSGTVRIYGYRNS